MTAIPACQGRPTIQYAPERVANTPLRDRKVAATRARIAETALDLFLQQGYAETTIDQIASSVGISRRTVFRHFATKEAILFEHLVVRHDTAVRLLRDRPAGEQPLVSLHAVLRELSAQGFDRRLAAQVRAVLNADPRLAAAELTSGTRAFEKNLTSTLQSRLGDGHTVEIYALTLMALSWFDAAVRLHYKEGRKSLLEYFDEVVATCLGPTTTADLAGTPASRLT
jgi:AcrR family transcriptional regulator